MSLSIVGPNIPNLPWQPRAAGDPDLVWRYDANPVIGRRSLQRVTGIYNSAVVPWQDGFIGVFRTLPGRRDHRLHQGQRAVVRESPPQSNLPKLRAGCQNSLRVTERISRAPAARFLTFLVFP